MEIDKDFCILVLSDNYSHLDILNGILFPYFNVKTTMHTEDALDLLKIINVNLIILDCIIENENDNDFFTKIKSTEETRKIPVILIGSSSNPEYEENSFELGAADYISRPFRASIIKMRVNNQRLIVKQMKAIEELGLQDYLTGISNRRGFDNRINLEWLRAIREKTHLSIAIVDIDNFKDYNDKYGHVQGDVLLRCLAKKFVSMLRRPADFVARWGGEEFVIMFPNTKLEGTVKHLEQIREEVQKMIIPNLPSATISIGAASMQPKINSSSETLFEKADKALYKAKNLGRNRVCF